MPGLQVIVICSPPRRVLGGKPAPFSLVTAKETGG